MRKVAVLFLLAIVSLLIVGCTGTTGRNSPVQIRIEGTGNTVAFGNVNLIVSPNGGASTSLNAVTNTQSQTWATSTSGAAFREVSFTTTSGRVPYFIYLQNTSGVQEEVRLRILIDGSEQRNIIVTVPANTTVQVATLLRNNVQD